jgi:hypothetical protein
MSILRDKEKDGTSYYVETDGKLTVKKKLKMLPIY